MQMRRGGLQVAGGSRSAVQEVGCHEHLQGFLRGDGELRDRCGAVGVLHFVGEIPANCLQDVGTVNRERNIYQNGQMVQF